MVDEQILKKEISYDYLIVGAGIVGMSIAYELIMRDSNLKIAIIEKERNVGFHASGRNSGVLHSGFYYTADSMKAKFTASGNKRMREFCHENDIFIRETKKIVVAKDESDLPGLYELQRRAKKNKVDVRIISAEEVREIDPNIKTYQVALYSPTTASVDPKEVCYKLRDILVEKNVHIYFDTEFKKQNKNYEYLINCAGLYADIIAKSFGLAQNFTLLPFKGIYLKYIENDTAIKTNIYPVPNLNNPFLGVHYTITASGSIKIGPTAIPALWRENYNWFQNFKLREMITILYYEAKLFFLNSFGFRKLALKEIQNIIPNKIIKSAQKMVHEIGSAFVPMPAGIRAQLLNTKTNELIQDYVIEHTENSTHILNAVSPAFTCSFTFAEYVVDQIKLNRER